MPIVRAMFRYPVKGLSGQPVRGVELEAGKPFPFDRVFALTRPGSPIDINEPRSAKKGRFLMLMLDEALARVRSHVDPATLRLRLEPHGAEESRTVDEGDTASLLDVDLGTSEGRERAAAFFHALSDLESGPTLVHAREGHFMDKPDNVMSCINLATVGEIEKDLGLAIDPLRFRANFYIDGAEPWQELAWVGHDIALGDVVAHVDRRNGPAAPSTSIPPPARDLDLPGELRKRYGHKDLGVYLVARKSGKVVVGDEVAVPLSKETADVTVGPSVGGTGIEPATRAV